MEIQYRDVACTVEFGRYAFTENIAIQLRENQTQELMVTATTNTSARLEDDIIAVKNWSENTGVDTQLLQTGVIYGDPVGYIPSGMVQIPVYRLTEKTKQALQTWEKEMSDEV